MVNLSQCPRCPSAFSGYPWSLMGCHPMQQVIEIVHRWRGERPRYEEQKKLTGQRSPYLVSSSPEGQPRPRAKATRTPQGRPWWPYSWSWTRRFWPLYRGPWDREETQAPGSSQAEVKKCPCWKGHTPMLATVLFRAFHYAELEAQGELGAGC